MRIPAKPQTGSRLWGANNPPGYVTGWRYGPQGVFIDNVTNLTTTATRLYYFPIRVWESHTFTGVECFNGGAGDNGETVRIGLYSHGTAGPNALQKDFGEITLTGASAHRTLTSSVTLSPAIYWLAFHANSAASWFTMVPYRSDVGFIPGMTPEIGTLTGGQIDTTPFFYVDTAYGAFAATAAAPNGVATVMPWIRLIA